MNEATAPHLESHPPTAEASERLVDGTEVVVDLISEQETEPLPESTPEIEIEAQAIYVSHEPVPQIDLLAYINTTEPLPDFATSTTTLASEVVPLPSRPVPAYLPRATPVAAANRFEHLAQGKIAS